MTAHRPISGNDKLKVKPPRGQLPVLQYCPPDQLLIDESYQRSLESPTSQVLVKKIAVDWDWGLCQPLFVARRTDGSLYVVDGQHRLAASKLRGDIWQLPCVVAPFSDSTEEAASFVALNQQRRPLDRCQIFKAALAAGSDEALAINAALEASGLWVGNSMSLNYQKPGAVNCVGALQHCFARYGSEVLTIAVEVMAQGFKGQPLRYGGTLLHGIAAIVAAELQADTRFREGERFTLMTEMVGGGDQAQWVQDILISAAAGQGSSRRNASILVFRLAWSECVAALEEPVA